jgi:hypothetical protein
MATRLPPDRRDLFLTVVDALAAGSVMLRGRMIANGYAANIADVLFDTAASGAAHRLPSMVTELLGNLYHLHPDDVPRTYQDAARSILLNHGAVEARRAEEEELSEITKWEAAVEDRRLRAAERTEAERLKAKAARAQRKQAKQQALRVAA